MKHLLLLFATAISVMASAQITTLPHVEPFSNATIPVGWTQVDHQGNGQVWTFEQGVEWDGNPVVLDGNYAVLNSDFYALSGVQNADLISPTFDLTGKSRVNLTFTHYFQEWAGSSATLSYSTDDGATWEPIKTWATFSPAPEIFTQNIPALDDQAQVKLKWNFTGDYGYGWAIDNVTVSESAELTWLGVSSDWNNNENWSSGAVPILGDYVLIPDEANDPIIFQNPGAECFNLTIESGASLTIEPGFSLTVSNTFTNNSSNGLLIKSDGTATGSLIAASQAGTGTANIQRYMEGDRWYYVASPVVQTIKSFLTANSDIPSNGDSRGMMDFNTGTISWNPYFETNTPGNLENGKGYGVRTKTDTYVTFNGNISAGEINVPLTVAGTNWNLIGNPYTSAIKINQDAGTNSFLNLNSIIFPVSYEAIYIWDGTAYEIINNISGAEFTTIGQAFFIKSGNLNALFTPEMQIHQPTELLKSGTVLPEVKISVTSSGKIASTRIMFVEGTTTGVDRGYDAGIFKADNSFSIFTKLVDDNNVEFGLQCLPTLSSKTMIVPIGIDLPAGGKMILSAQRISIPEESSIVLEDRLLNVFTSFSDANSEYRTTVAANTNGTGRFYLHVSGNAQVTGINEAMTNKISAWTERNEIVINGITENNAVAKLFDIRGSSVLVKNLDRTTTNRINVNGLNSGIYMLQVVENGKRTGIKLHISGN